MITRRVFMGAMAGGMLATPPVVEVQPARKAWRVAALAHERRLPTVSLFTEFAQAGGLPTYGPNLLESMRRGGTYVRNVLNGAKPADVPIERPEKFELVINLKTAKALGLTIPPSLLVRADEVIQ